MSAARTPKFEAVLAMQRARYLEQKVFDWEHRICPIQSPIEQVFLGEMLASLWVEATASDLASVIRATEDAGLSIHYPPDVNRPHWSKDRLQEFILEASDAVCITQPWMQLSERRIRPDFAFVLPHPECGAKVIVELDGHDFHERTPEQAQLDKSRDRELQALGWSVLRFTGREVLRSPEKCLDEVHTLLFARLAMRRAQKEQA